MRRPRSQRIVAQTYSAHASRTTVIIQRAAEGQLVTLAKFWQPYITRVIANYFVLITAGVEEGGVSGRNAKLPKGLIRNY